MSIALMATAWKLDVDPAAKLVLLALADWSNDDGYCWPSIRQLCLKCSISERTVQTHIKGLCAAGHITRAERPGHGVHYRVHPMAPAGPAADAQEQHYVYRLTNPDTGEFYIGARSCFGAIEADPYMGSGNWARRMADALVPLEKTIIERYPNRDALAFGELSHAGMVFNDPLCRNEQLPRPGVMTKPNRQATPAKSAPRKSCAPQNTTETPANSAPNTSIYTNNGVTDVTPPPTPQPPKPVKPAPAGKAAAKPDAVPMPDLPDWVPPDAWAGFVDSRRQLKKPLTPHAATLIVAKLKALSLAGHPPGAVLDQSTMNGWQGVFKLKGDDDGGRGGQWNGAGGGNRTGDDGGYRNPLARAAAEDARKGFQ